MSIFFKSLSIFVGFPRGSFFSKMDRCRSFGDGPQFFRVSVFFMLVNGFNVKCFLILRDWKRLSEMQEKSSRQFSTAVGRCTSYKNRFQDILPYDQNRIILEDSKDDYINASLVDGISPYSPRFIGMLLIILVQEGQVN